MWNWIWNLSEMAYPNRRWFLWMIWATILPKPPLNFGKIVDVAEKSLWWIFVEVLDEDVFAKIFQARLKLEWEARKTFFKRLNTALKEKWFHVFWEVDLDDQEGLWEKILRRWFYDSIQSQLQESLEITQLRNISISGAECTYFEILVDCGSLAHRIREFWQNWVLGDIEPLEITSTLQARVEDWSIELKLFKDRTIVYVDKENNTPGIIEQYVLKLPRDLDSVLDFLKKPALEIVQIVKTEWLVFEEYFKREYWIDIWKGKNVDGDTSVNWIEKYWIFLNSTALTPIAHIKNRVYDVTQDAPQDFPLSFAVQEMLWKTELDVKVLINNISHL